MIIRRLSRNLAEQNWTAVTIDFVVVVLGIFLGLQITAWNQDRLDRQEADYYINFLYEDLLVAIEAADEEIERREQTLADSFGAGQLLLKESWSEEESREFAGKIASTFELWGPNQRPVALRRMIDDGKIDLIESKDLQLAILRFETAYIDAIDQTETSYSYSLAVTPKITAALTFAGPRLATDPETLLGNQTLVTAVRDKAVLQRIQLDVLKDLQAARIRLKEELERD